MLDFFMLWYKCLYYSDCFDLLLCSIQVEEILISQNDRKQLFALLWYWTCNSTRQLYLKMSTRPAQIEKKIFICVSHFPFLTERHWNDFNDGIKRDQKRIKNTQNLSMSRASHSNKCWSNCIMCNKTISPIIVCRKLYRSCYYVLFWKPDPWWKGLLKC